MTLRLLEHRVEEPAGRCGPKQSLGGLLKGREVRYGPHPDHGGEVGMIAEVGDQAAVVEAREFLEHQAGQQLGLSELLRAVLVPVCRESPTGAIVGNLQNSARGFARRHISYYVAIPGQVRCISTEHISPLFPSARTPLIGDSLTKLTEILSLAELSGFAVLGERSG
jgi:hypothetical protein